MEYLEYELIKIGNLKYSRLKALSILRKELNKWYSYSMSDCKLILDSLLSSSYKEKFNYIHRKCFDLIFDGNEYIEYDNNPFIYEKNFPDNWIPPVG